ncbi:hypothetical protein Tsubulata_040452 [Turnera subulata]|uniref:Cytochrome P450 n=1 Tax=Turnera subulata TaxID=218843 RepID=A0A9Q0G177_9ROSI|nr:hypothetical protein Tsubulata_040452 [Turnera subulata]
MHSKLVVPFSGPLLIPRESGESCEINGYHIPAKSRIIINAWPIARDPNYWAEPETFFPERFLENPVGHKGQHFQFIPFGAGRRMCPGASIGLATVELTLAQTLFHFDWKLPAGQEAEALDMAECHGSTVKRKYDLQLVSLPYATLISS